VGIARYDALSSPAGEGVASARCRLDAACADEDAVMAGREREVNGRISMPEPLYTERIEAQRSKLFSAISIVACCRLSCTSRAANKDPDILEEALQVAEDLINQAAGEMGVLAEELDGHRSTRTNHKLAPQPTRE
jgi:hypothetical protein